jgi:hypothetical protein
MATVLHYSGVPAAAVLGTALDCQQYDGGHVVFTTYAANASAEDITLMKITESDAVGGTYTDVAGADFTAIATGANDAIEIASLQLRARKRFLKFSALGGGSNDSLLVVVAQLIGASESSKNADTYVFEG